MGLIRAVVLLLSLSLVACGDQSTSSPAIVTGFAVEPGAGEVTLTWDSHPGQVYAAYYKLGANVTVADYDNLIVPVTSPYVISNLANDSQYAFILTATNAGSVAGPASPVVTAVTGSGGGIVWSVGTPLATAALLGVAVGNSTFVTVGTNAAIFSTNDSNNNAGGGSVWTQATSLPAGLSATLSSVIYDGVRFVALGVDGSVITSSDTLVWDAAMPVTSGVTMYSLAYGSNTYVAVGAGGAIASNSSSAVSAAWTAQTSGTTQDLYSVSYVHGVFVAVGAQGTLLTSSDGVNWIQRATNTTENLRQAAYGDGVSTYIVVGDSGTVLASLDSATWLIQTSPTPQNLYAICFTANSQFVAVGDGGVVAYSATGASDSWTVSTVGNNALYGIASGGVLIAVGEAGANVRGE